jgi:hypothetical protein
MTKQEIIAKLNSELPQFSGSEKFYRYMGNCLLTEGTKFLADTAGCFWFMDIIASYQHEREFKLEDFQVWTVTVDATRGTARVTCTDGDKGDGPVTLCTQEIASTDFPLPKFTVWAERNETGGITILLPSEH